MSPRSILVVVLALVFGGSAAVGVNSLLQNQQMVPKGEVVSVLVAAIDVPRGGMLTAELVKSREYPKDIAPVGALSKVEEALDRTVFIPLIKDDPILNAKLAPKGSGRGMSALVPKGMRAFTIQTPSIESGVAGFVLPGNKVDVLLTVGDLPTSNFAGHIIPDRFSGHGPPTIQYTPANRWRQHDHAAPERRDPGGRSEDRGARPRTRWIAKSFAR